MSKRGNDTFKIQAVKAAVLNDHYKKGHNVISKVLRLELTDVGRAVQLGRKLMGTEEYKWVAEEGNLI